MRKSAGLLITVLLLLVVPVLASAMTLTIKVTGPTGVAGNNVALSGGTAATVTSGLKYYYPTTATSATISMAAGYTSTVKVDGITQNPNYTGTVGPWTSGSHSVEVAYSGTAATTYAVTITQTTGGTVSIKLPNGTSNSSGASGVSSGTSMPITISAAAGYKIATYNIGAGVVAYGGTVAGEVLTLPFTCTANTAVTATYTQAPTLSASLSAPLNGYTNTAVNVKTTATSTAFAAYTSSTGIMYKYNARKAAAGSASVGAADSTTKTFAFTPDTVTDYIVSVKAYLTANTAVFKNMSSRVTVTSLTAAMNNQCTSCHGPSPLTFSQIVADYNAGVNAGVTACNNAACHGGSPHTSLDLQKGNFALSSHKNGAHGILYGANICTTCHSHKTNPTAAYVAYSSTGKVSRTQACQQCHAIGSGYGVFNSQTDTDLKKPHGNANKVFTMNVGVTTVGWYSGSRYVFANASTSYVSPADACSNCHGHNNVINGEYAENYHSANNRWKTSSSRAWKYQGYSSAVTPANVSTDGCVRCHTTTGYVNFVANFTNLQAWGFQETGYTVQTSSAAANNTNTVSEAVNCRACHTDAEGTVRVVAAAQAYYNMTTVPFGKLNSGLVQYSDFKNSNVCIPCHMGRNGATNGNLLDTIATNFAAFASMTSLTVGTVSVSPGVPHGVNQAGILDANMGYKFGNSYVNGTNSHAYLGRSGGDVATTTDAGPCVTCHMDNDSGHRKHGFEVYSATAGNKLAVPTVCSNCHGKAFNGNNIIAAEEKFNAAVKVLAEIMADETLTFTGTPLLSTSYGWANAGGGPGANSAGNKYNFAGKAADLKKVLGAYYNLKLLQNDVAAFAHNPGYAKWLIAQSIDAVRVTSASTPAAGVTSKTTTSAADAISKVTPVTGSTSRPTASDITEAAEFLKADGHYASGTYKVQYVLNGGSDCATCHYPNESDTQAAARVAWSESGHGETTALPWIPASNHLWRAAGVTTSFATNVPATDCVRCHTAAGFAQFVGADGSTAFTNVKAVATDGTVNSPLNCNTCHVNPLTSTSARLTVPAVSTYYNISSAGVKAHLNATFPDVGESNMCIPCHAGRLSGAALVTAAPGLNFSNSSFQNSHYMAAAGLMYAKVGFTAFTTATTPVASGSTTSYGMSLTSNADMTVSTTGAAIAGALTSTHRNLGTAAMHGDSHNTAYFVSGNLDTNGPCVTCHLKGYETDQTVRPGAGHSLKVDAAAWQNTCNNCHAAEAGMNAAGDQPLLVEEQKVPFDTAMSILQTLVQTKLGTEFDSSAYPYFYKAGFAHTSANALKNWTAFTTGLATPLKNEGAAFNLNLLAREPYAFLHARTYTRRLIYDTIDYLDDGLMNQSVSTYLAASGGIGAKPADASGTTANDAVWQYFLGYNRTSKAWNTAERP
ncbi:hypothetical protein FO488_00465 [Geobacter sp. FeAm09]|uniref:hypothetical protein n=1 Tax=Geobacter sp. FeAm09 TaxID=2597769 RepID=UPI0011EC0E39|nr:hypothetical protein [Geobacter sp. FeAm09]QEM66780.1 hypothetical protein FO488_00465 [Geobacter sp. FeAm09]